MCTRVAAHAALRRAGRMIAVLIVLVLLCSCQRRPVRPAPRLKGPGERLAAVARAGGVKEPRVLKAMAKVPREEFVPPDQRAYALEDRPLPIGLGQTISQPSLVALMTELLRLSDQDKVLEIGTGSGYQAAILAELTPHVYTIEILPELATTAEARLKRLGYTTVKVKTGDGYQGWPEFAPFDAIIVTCAPDHVPEPLVEQLKDGGRMVIPVGPAAGAQELYLLEKQHGKLMSREVVPVRFVPLVREPASAETPLPTGAPPRSTGGQAGPRPQRKSPQTGAPQPARHCAPA